MSYHYTTRLTLLQRAESFRNRFCRNAPFPLDIEYLLEKELGLELIPVSALRQTTRVSAYLKADFSGIVIDAEEYIDERFTNRLRFSLAHEIGHFILHRDIFRAQRINSIDEYIEQIDELNEENWCGLEWQANQFAGFLLVPYHELEHRVDETLREIEKRNLAGFLLENGEEVSSQVAPFLGRYFGVSAEVIERRLYDEGWWPINRLNQEWSPGGLERFRV